MIGIIGSEGFVGRAVKLQLQQMPANFRLFDISFRIGSDEFLDVANPIDPSRFQGVTTLINLAAEHRDDVKPLSRYHEVNVNGAKNICAAATEAGVASIIFTSSVAVYGFAPPDTAEDGAVNYFNEYGKTKYLAEQVYKAWQMEIPDQRCLVIVRPTVIFGPANRGNVFNLMQQVASGRFIMIGDGTNIKSMAYVENVAAFLVHSLSFGVGVHLHNYVDKPDFDMDSLVRLCRSKILGRSSVGLRLPGYLGLFLGRVFDIFSRLVKRPLPVSHIRVTKFMATTQFASNVADTGFIARFTLNDGLEKTLSYEFPNGESM